MQISERNAEEARRRARENSGPMHLTEQGLRRLESQLERLKQGLPALIEEAARTAAYGDRSDNAEYKDAKGRLRRANWRILEIQDQVKRAVIIPTGSNTSGIVELGSTVVVETGGRRKTFQIVGSHETDPAHGRISFQSPLGAALLQHAAGDIITIKTENGQCEYRIVAIR